MSKKLKKIQTQNNYNYKDHKGEIPKGVSLTIPDQSMSIRQLIERHTRGQQIPIHMPSYQFTSDSEIDESMNIPDMEKLDYFEKVELKENVQETIDETKKSIKARVKRVNKLAEAQKLAKQQAKPSEGEAKKISEGKTEQKQ